MKYIVLFLCTAPVLLYVNILRRRNSQSTYEWKKDDALVVSFMADRPDFLGMVGNKVLVDYYNKSYRVSLWRVKRNSSLDRRKADEFLKFREELHEEQ